MHYIVWWIKLLENESKTIINFPVSAWNVDLRVLLLVVVTTGIVVSQIANRIDRRTSTIVVSPGETEHHGHTPHIAFDNHVYRVHVRAQRLIFCVSMHICQCIVDCGGETNQHRQLSDLTEDCKYTYTL